MSAQTTRPEVSFGQCTDVGKIRKENQDACGFWESEDDAVFEKKGRLLVVCDGMGGAAGGQIASTMAVKTIIETYQEHEAEAIHEAIWHSIVAANAKVHAESIREDREELRGMGTTVVALVHQGDQVHLAHVGDSRIYLIQDDTIVQLTRDHTLVQDLVDKGELEPDEIESHPDKSVLMRSMGPNPHVAIDLSFGEALRGNTYLLCTDGLTGLVSDEEILRIIALGARYGHDLDKVSKQLVDLANAYAGHDNTTVQLLHLHGTSGEEEGAPDEAEEPDEHGQDEPDADTTLEEGP